MKVTIEIQSVSGGFVARVDGEVEPSAYGSTPRTIAGRVRDVIEDRLKKASAPSGIAPGAGKP